MSRKYYTDPWLRKLNTTLVSSRREGPNYAVVLSETIFYPTGGGQPHDLGFINNLPLLDVYETEGVIYHVLPEPVNQTEIECILDWERRLDHMQQHTGQHLLSAVLLAEFNYTTESFHLGGEYSSIDISAAELCPEEQRKAEGSVNEMIFRNLPIYSYIVPPEKLGELPLRKLPDLQGGLRIVEIENFDYSPCSGTHLASTGQLGLFKITRAEKYKGMTRIYFLCGKRALRDYEMKHRSATELSSLLSVPVQELAARVSAELKQKRSLERKIEEIEIKIITLQAEAIVKGQTGCLLTADLPEGSLKDARLLAKSILGLGTFGVIINLENHLVLAHNLPKALHCGRLVEEHARPLGGKGGGGTFSAEVYFADTEKKAEFYQLVQKNFQLSNCK